MSELYTLELFETVYKSLLRIITIFHKNQNHNTVNKIRRFWMVFKSKVILQVGLQFILPEIFLNSLVEYSFHLMYEISESRGNRKLR